MKILCIDTLGRMDPGMVTQDAAMQEVTLLTQFTSSSFVEAKLSGDKRRVMIVTDFVDNQPFHVQCLFTLILYMCDAFLKMNVNLCVQTIQTLYNDLSFKDIKILVKMLLISVERLHAAGFAHRYL